MPTLDAAAKDRLKQAIVAHLREAHAATRENVDEQSDAAEVVTTDTVDVDEKWQAEQAGDLVELLDDAAEQQADEIAAVEALDFSPTDVVRPGAVVTWDGESHVVGAVFDEVTVDGATYLGLSTESPAYQAIEGLAAGDTFTLLDVEHTLDAVA